jgi:hypothetical protein
VVAGESLVVRLVVALALALALAVSMGSGGAASNDDPTEAV